MARRKHERMSPEKKNLISSRIKMYDIQSVEDTQDALKDLLGDTIKDRMEGERDEPLFYDA